MRGGRSCGPRASGEALRVTTWRLGGRTQCQHPAQTIGARHATEDHPGPAAKLIAGVTAAMVAEAIAQRAAEAFEAGAQAAGQGLLESLAAWA